ncbi:MAG: MotA/TolQ/ExbB proton channel family protein [Verrucomicrobia bacterium]|nr:MotA/TolQ/ExbB proton channel family protein [Verrucomicrobiota bacterium]
MLKNQIRRLIPFVLVPLIVALSSANAAAAEESVIKQILHGGAMVIFVWICLLATSVIMVTFIIQLAISMQKAKLAPPPLVESLRQLIGSGNYQESWETCNANKNYLANVLKAGLGRIGRGKEAVETGLAEHGLREATLLRTRNSYLSVIGVVSPMIGLLGTVIGMMGAFSVLGASGMGNPKELAGKISEVLLATASGLFIAIPAFVAYYIFRNMSQASIVHADDIVNTLVIDIPYDELAGIQIGENFAAAGIPQTARPAGGAPAAAAAASCPVCAGNVAIGQSPCPHCGSVLSW